MIPRKINITRHVTRTLAGHAAATCGENRSAVYGIGVGVLFAEREREREGTHSLYRVPRWRAHEAAWGRQGGRKCVSAAGGHRARDARFGHQIDIRIQ